MWEFDIIWLTKILCKILFAINFSSFVASSQISSRIFTENFLIKINFPSRKCNIFHRRFEISLNFCVKIVRCFQRSRWDKVFPSTSFSFCFEELSTNILLRFKVRSVREENVSAIYQAFPSRSCFQCFQLISWD